MKNLVICFDGTWNTPDQEQNEVPAPTNVVRLYNAIASMAQDVIQETYYHPGVGTEGGLLSRSAGGMYGLGLSKNIISAYTWLGTRYEAGDKIFLFGFSRGAFTVRSLAGFLARCGLLDLKNLESSDGFARVEIAYQQGYRDRKKNWLRNKWALLAPAPLSINFIGVWDTVGALGVPDDLALLNLLDKSENWQFHDTHLDESVNCARHAMAIDECRASFTPTPWTDPATGAILSNNDRVQQLWFPGVHADVGGGYAECGLSDIALKWMIDEASNKGLAFRTELVSQLQPNSLGVLHDSVRGVFKALRTRPRNVPCLLDKTSFHPSAIDRHKVPPITQTPYHVTNTLASGQEAYFPVYAFEHWNRTGLYLEKGGVYEFTAKGEWVDGSITCGPNGSQDGKFQPAEVAHVLSSFLGKIEGVFKKITGNEQADFWGTRRVESMPWFSLVGVIANDGQSGDKATVNDGSPTPHETFLIGTGPVRITVQNPGYLYAFTNDAWAFYNNNRGSVTVKVKRLKIIL